jgi:hypothetical protein
MTGTGDSPRGTPRPPDDDRTRWGIGGAAPTVQPLRLRLALAVLGVVVAGVSAVVLAQMDAHPLVVALAALVAVVAAVDAVALTRRIRRR